MPSRLFILSLVALTTCASRMVSAEERLSEQIDRLIETAPSGPLAPVSGDAEFLRRVSLDLHGVIPTASELRQFLEDPAPNKRELAIDRLLASPRHAIHLASVFDVMWMERRADKHVTTAEWLKYLQSAFERNVGYDQLARDILSADGTDPERRAAAKFFLDRDAEPHVMTRDVGRMFFGIDLQCAQCHDHPLVDHYLQTDYYGLFAFVNRTVIFTDEAAKKSYLGEKSDGDATYKSVFTQDAGQIRPQLPGENELDEPRYRQGEDYVAPPLPNVRPVPKYSRHLKLAELATNGSNRQFNLNITNRMWAHMMGRGLVSPVDLHHPLNPATHPDVLDLITNEFVAHKYDLRWLLRELALTRTYQRTIDPPSSDIRPQLAAAIAELPTLSADYEKAQAAVTESDKQAEAALAEFKTARAALAAAEIAWKTAEAAVAAAKKPVDEVLTAIAKSEGQLAAKQPVVQVINETAAKASEAAKLLPNDKELVAAIATIVARQQQLAGEVDALQKAIAEQIAKKEPLQTKLTEAYGPADVAYASYQDARKPVDDLRAKYIAVWNQHKSRAAAAAHLRKRVDADRLQSTQSTNFASLESVRTSLAAREAAVVVAMTSMAEQQSQVTNLANGLAEANQASTAATKSLAEAQSQLVAKQSVVQAISEAIAKTEEALRNLPEDADLTAASAKLKDRLGPLKTEVANQEQSVNDHARLAKEAASKLESMQQSFAAASTELAGRQQAVTAASEAVTQGVSSMREAEAALTAGTGSLVDLWTANGGIRPLRAMTPEQLGWSVMQATGVLQGQRGVAEAEIEKTISKASVANDPVQAHLRDVRFEQQLNEQMRGHVAQFVNLYGASAGQPQDDFFATPDQALFAANGPTLIGWSQGGELAQRLSPLNDASAFASELYLSVLSRPPTDGEVQEVARYLESHSAERPLAIRDLIWSLLTSAEFRFNH